MRIIRVLLEFVAYPLERKRLYNYVNVHGKKYSLEHKGEWVQYAMNNWASRISGRLPTKVFLKEKVVENKPQGVA